MTRSNRKQTLQLAQLPPPLCRLSLGQPEFGWPFFSLFVIVLIGFIMPGECRTSSDELGKSALKRILPIMQQRSDYFSFYHSPGKRMARCRHAPRAARG